MRGPLATVTAAALVVGLLGATAGAARAEPVGVSHTYECDLSINELKDGNPYEFATTARMALPRKVAPGTSIPARPFSIDITLPRVLLEFGANHPLGPFTRLVGRAGTLALNTTINGVEGKHAIAEVTTPSYEFDGERDLSVTASGTLSAIDVPAGTPDGSVIQVRLPDNDNTQDPWFPSASDTMFVAFTMFANLVSDETGLDYDAPARCGVGDSALQGPEIATIEVDDSLIAPEVALLVPASVVHGRAATASVSVPGATGEVTVVGAGETRTVTLQGGSAAVVLPGDLAAGTHQISAIYDGDDIYGPGAAAASLTVARAPSAALKAKGASIVHGRSGTISVTAPAAGAVTVAGLGTKTATTAGQGLAFTVPKTLRAGTTTYRASFVPADGNYASPSPIAVRVGVAKAGTRASVRVLKRPTSKKKGKAVVTVRSVTGTKPRGTVTVTLKKGKKTKRVRAKVNANGQASVRLPKLAKGAWKVTAAYAGDANHVRKSIRKKLKVTK
ncbi:hypothetical protein BHE97_08275 [Aeromicrobium sp. PE09-221]|uniref:Ig-like domain-containing protein n=1 Tax=Aeromicrobium sp. PE09-221 TaxID=1898043 RepID=UPI000B3E6096|nr:Ig-like domain-containing protein [Aeromicrobium sp. PE09-221]OUZ10327.1 hypothetical protein BHE97_08275 [Aeromicrobium sp. PE09-221]